MNPLTNALNQHWPSWRAWVAITRVDKPVGSYLLLWPTFWALWVAAEGVPSLANLIIFTLGVFLMRSAGCVINDIADRNIDGHVKRTNDRPLATGALTTKAAVIGFALLCAVAFVLVLLTNSLTIMLSFGGVALAALYPFMKRHTHLPQVFLGAAFSWAIPMAFAAEAGALPAYLWLLYAANLCWTVAYDTYYAMVDRDDDLKIGVKSTAILFGDADLVMIAVLKAMALAFLAFAGAQFSLGWPYFVALLVGALYFAWQLWSARDRSRDACFQVFRQSHWFGLIVLVGLSAHYALQ
ncbi:MAG: 4-hydroxybenzoate octaprenyltransferase [Pseudomonadota bacterium]|nr:4-hydroxybenzoate octaprenyltransferase [Pseudomonadota bacterium]